MLKRMLRVLGILVLVTAFVFFSSTKACAKDLTLLTTLGKRISYSSICGKQFTLIYLVKPWHGITKDLIGHFKKHEEQFYGRIKPILIFSKVKRVVVNKYLNELKLKTTSSYIDDTLQLTKKFNPSFLPSIILINSEGRKIYESSYVSSDLVKQLTSNPSYLLKKLEKQTLSDIESEEHIHPVHSPWGPPDSK